MIRISYDNFYVSAGNQYYHTFFDIYTFPIIRCMCFCIASFFLYLRNILNSYFQNKKKLIYRRL